MLDSYESIIDVILERYLLEDANPIHANNYIVKLQEIGDTDGPIDIENNQDLELAFETPRAKTKGHIKMSAMIRLKSEPIIMQGSDESTAN